MRPHYALINAALVQNTLHELSYSSPPHGKLSVRDNEKW